MRPLILLCVLTSSVAHADFSLPEKATWLMVGPLFSSSSQNMGLGLETSLNFSGDIYALGMFGQAQWMEDSHTRLAAGIQGNLLVLGLELGVMHDTESRLYAATTGLHVTPYVSFIYCSVGLRMGIPLYAPDNGLPRRGFEAAFVISAKLPVLLGGSGDVPFTHL